MSTTLQLAQLQKIDTRVDEANKRIAEITRLLGNNELISAATEELARSMRALAANQTLQDEQEAEAERIRIKIAQSESSLYGGKINNPKELNDLQHEIASLKKHLKEIEDRILELMGIVETCSEDQAVKKAALADLQAKFAQINAGLIGERGSLETEVNRLLQERNMLSAQMDSEWLSTYEVLRVKKRGVALSITKDRSCGACGAILTPADWQAARSPSRLFFCPACGRIIYAG